MFENSGHGLQCSIGRIPQSSTVQYSVNMYMIRSAALKMQELKCTWSLMKNMGGQSFQKVKALTNSDANRIVKIYS